MLDLESLRLTRNEGFAAQDKTSNRNWGSQEGLIAEAQFAKLALGLHDWLANEGHLPGREPMHRDQDRLRARQISDSLVKIGVKRPEAKP